MTRRPQQSSDISQRSRRSLTLATRALIVILATAGLTWAAGSFPRSEAADDFTYLENRLLHFESFSPAISGQVLNNSVSQSLSVCDTHAQRAMLLIEMPLAETALRSGAVDEFDRHIRALEARSREILGCMPRDSFAWLLAFDLAVLHGELDNQAFDLLAMSYETSPNEAWISVRRIIVAMPVLMLAPQPVRQSILSEFQRLIRNGFTDDAARCYSAASPSIRSVLQDRVEQLDVAQRKRFSDALATLRSWPLTQIAHHGAT